MRGYVNDGSGTNGAADGANIFFGSYQAKEWARSSDVVFHEYTHNTVYHVYGGWIGDPTSQGDNLESSAMDEGLSDYFASTINNDASFGEDVPLTEIRTLSNSYAIPNDWRVNQRHWNGQIVAGAVWDTRQSVGDPTIGNNLAFKALQVVPRARDFSAYLYNKMIVDNGTYNATYRTRLRNAFAAHGITTTEPLWPGPSNLTYTGQQGQSPTLQWQYSAQLTSASATFVFIVVQTVGRFRLSPPPLRPRILILMSSLDPRRYRLSLSTTLPLSTRPISNRPPQTMRP